MPSVWRWNRYRREFAACGASVASPFAGARLLAAARRWTIVPAQDRLGLLRIGMVRREARPARWITVLLLLLMPCLAACASDASGSADTRAALERYRSELSRMHPGKTPPDLGPDYALLASTVHLVLNSYVDASDPQVLVDKALEGMRRIRARSTASRYLPPRWFNSLARCRSSAQVGWRLLRNGADRSAQLLRARPGTRPNEPTHQRQPSFLMSSLSLLAPRSPGSNRFGKSLGQLEHVITPARHVEEQSARRQVSALTFIARGSHLVRQDHRPAGHTRAA